MMLEPHHSLNASVPLPAEGTEKRASLGSYNPRLTDVPAASSVTTIRLPGPGRIEAASRNANAVPSGGRARR